ncbi:MAG TPA: aminotransferase class III-fold pyridoxal phosphate-dependent enzyme [Thermopetrobacter sp.]|nr:aminotransferase class III-fold pyridoxal phosphate-dependent enzyme [Thermopetrobacter sp.]
MAELSNLDIRDIETLVHPYTNLAAHRRIGPVVLERGRGAIVWDAEGREYIEGLAGLWCTSLGYGNEELVEAAREQMERLSFAHLFGHKSHDVAVELAERIKEMAPFPVARVLFCSGGSEANDQQVKLTWYYNNARGKPEKKKFISRHRAYHGVTVAAGSLTGLPVVHRDFDLPLPQVVHTACPDYYRDAEEGESERDFSRRMAAELEELIRREGPDTVAAFIAEPVMGAGGVIIPPEGYFEEIGKVLARYDVRIISDEVITGFGRTGEMFGCQAVGLKPTSMSVAKAITSAYVPLGAMTVEEELHEAMLAESEKIGIFAHGFTYTGHPVACAVALKTLEIYERDDIPGMVRARTPQFAERMARLADHPLVGSARSIGLMGGVELVADKAAKRLFDPKAGVGAHAMLAAQAHGLITRNVGGDIIALCPPLIISDEEIDEMFDRLEKALDDTEAWVRREGLREA